MKAQERIQITHPYIVPGADKKSDITFLCQFKDGVEGRNESCGGRLLRVRCLPRNQHLVMRQAIGRLKFRIWAKRRHVNNYANCVHTWECEMRAADRY